MTGIVSARESEAGRSSTACAYVTRFGTRAPACEEGRVQVRVPAHASWRRRRSERLSAATTLSDADTCARVRLAPAMTRAVTQGGELPSQGVLARPFGERGRQTRSRRSESAFEGMASPVERGERIPFADRQPVGNHQVRSEVKLVVVECLSRRRPSRCNHLGEKQLAAGVKLDSSGLRVSRSTVRDQ